MLELDITHMVEKDGDEMPLLSGSVAELGPMPEFSPGKTASAMRRHTRS